MRWTESVNSILICIGCVISQFVLVVLYLSLYWLCFVQNFEPAEVLLVISMTTCFSLLCCWLGIKNQPVSLNIYCRERSTSRTLIISRLMWLTQFRLMWSVLVLLPNLCMCLYIFLQLFVRRIVPSILLRIMRHRYVHYYYYLSTSQWRPHLQWELLPNVY